MDPTIFNSGCILAQFCAELNGVNSNVSQPYFIRTCSTAIVQSLISPSQMCIGFRSPVESMTCKTPWVVVNKSLLSTSLVYIEERRMAAAVGSFAGVGGISSPSSEANDEFRAVSSSCCSARMSSILVFYYLSTLLDIGKGKYST